MTGRSAEGREVPDGPNPVGHRVLGSTGPTPTPDAQGRVTDVDSSGTGRAGTGPVEKSPVFVTTTPCLQIVWTRDVLFMGYGVPRSRPNITTMAALGRSSRVSAGPSDEPFPPSSAPPPPPHSDGIHLALPTTLRPEPVHTSTVNASRPTVDVWGEDGRRRGPTRRPPSSSNCVKLSHSGVGPLPVGYPVTRCPGPETDSKDPYGGSSHPCYTTRGKYPTAFPVHPGSAPEVRVDEKGFPSTPASCGVTRYWTPSPVV